MDFHGHHPWRYPTMVSPDPWRHKWQLLTSTSKSLVNDDLENQEFGSVRNTKKLVDDWDIG